ncbi:alpha/beta-hydrolase [Trematosphaeria pertusa]|uniref:Carboxylic ester hydrolase n=1 Tax=Trematosphaeria pertusa TaxID=390896 RepID=A0A6A6IKT1_9PLEO|nr:alpha/beta-hydrolase [Trematosphaeria pertusa]KAF2251225.1 alpha/beta-hydrolase [Trematosphaeria pertusa]
MFLATARLGGIVAFASLAKGALYNQVISTKYGDVQGYPAFNGSTQGIDNWQDITVWKGIPYAASTAVSNRFKPPQPVSAWNTTMYAKDFGPVCPATLGEVGDHTLSEDCLSLNIWTAANSTDAKLPVAIWSYPAGSTSGDALFDGGGMADKGVVHVTYNYRNGALGWLAHPWLSAEMSASYGTNSSGNWAVLDQQAAVKWIHENIAAFGGDPDQITVMGQSAGSAATYHIVNSPLVKGLIKGAIIQSGVRYPKDPLCSSLAENYGTLDAALAKGSSYVSGLNATSLEELRALPLSAFGTTASPPGQGNDSFGAVLDHYALPTTYMESLLQGAANDVPIMTGNTKDESGASYGLNISASTYLSDLNTTYESWANDFLAAYGGANSSAAVSAAYNAQWSDRSAVGTWLWSQLWATSSQQPVYNYFWDHAPPGQTQGAYHESEINYVLNNLYGTDLPWTADDYAIAEKMNAYWVNFIKTGDPNGGNLTRWEQTGAEQIVQRVGNGWGAMPLTHVELFEEWFGNLTTVY